MPKIAYINKEFSASKLALIEQANAIIREYQAAGFTLTLRQLYYQHVARGLLANRQQEYKRLGDLVSDGRMAGLIDWDAIEDRTRSLRSTSWWSGPEDIVKTAAASFDLDMWANQEHRPEVWIEKDALIGVIEGVCNKYRVPYFSCRGYTSQSELWRAGRRLARHVAKGQTPVIFHFGDHDPSGMDMTRDVTDRLEIFSEGTVRVDRLALNMDQVEKYQPPPNPAKITDSRAAKYIEIHGDESWELDALDPKTLAALIEKAIKSVRDWEKWKMLRDKREDAKATLTSVSDNWGEVEGFVKGLGE